MAQDPELLKACHTVRHNPPVTLPVTGPLGPSCVTGLLVFQAFLRNLPCDRNLPGN